MFERVTMGREKTSLPLVRDRGGMPEYRPNSSDLNLGMRIATTPEAALDFRNQVEGIYSRAKLLGNDAVKNAIAVLTKHANVQQLLQDCSGGIWAGMPPEDVVKAALHLEEDKIIGEEANDIREVHFALSDNAELVRGYLAAGSSSLDEATVNKMDEHFNTWLKNNQLHNEGGVIYELETDPEQARINGSSIKRDRDGNELRVNPVKFKELVHNDQQGYQAYLKNHKSTSHIEIREQPYPEQPKLAAGEEPAEKPRQSAGQEPSASGM